MNRFAKEFEFFNACIIISNQLYQANIYQNQNENYFSCLRMKAQFVCIHINTILVCR